MNAPPAVPIVRNVALAQAPQGPVSLPDGSERVPLGSGVITRMLGRGGMAAVYEVWNAQLEMYRAVKLIHPNATEHVHERFQTEIKISAKLSHPNIVEIHGVGEWKKLPFIEMEKIEGAGLDALITRRGALPAFVCTAVGIQVCRALDYAHNQECSIYGRTYHGVIHRDLKPSNMMVTEGGVVKLMDFGIARPPDVSFHTMDGLIAGTLQYLAPEQLEKKTLDFRTDIYALGVTMYELLAGINAFPQTSFAQLVSDKTRNKFKPLEEYHVRVPGRLKRAIYKCMHQDPAHRFSSARQLMVELGAIHAHLTSDSPEKVLASLVAAPGEGKIVLKPRRRFPWPPVAALATLALGLILGYGYLRPILLEKTRISRPAVPGADSLQGPASAQSSEASPVAAQPEARPSPRPTQSPRSVVAPPTPRARPGDSEMPVQKKTAPAAERTGSPIDALREKYATDDPVEIMAKELAARNYRSVLSVFDALPPDRASSTHALVLKLRALQALGNAQAVGALLSSVTDGDGEFVLARAKLAYDRGDAVGAKRLLDLCVTSVYADMDRDTRLREIAYYRALCAVAEFDANPSKASQTAAVQAWWELRTLLKSAPNHEYNNRGNAELQRMARMMQEQGGE